MYYLKAIPRAAQSPKCVYFIVAVENVFYFASCLYQNAHSDNKAIEYIGKNVYI